MRTTENDRLGLSNPVTYTFAQSKPNNFLISFSTAFVAVAVKAPTTGRLGKLDSQSPINL